MRAAAAVRHSVVSISIYEKKSRSADYSKVAYASGTVIDGGYIVTNYHVVMKGDYYQVRYDDGGSIQLERFKNGKMFLADTKTDIALLKMSDSDRRKLRPVQFEDSNLLSEGEWVLAVGNPYGLRRTVTGGIVSSKGRDNIGFADIEDFIQTDVPINPGNSGGPLINLEGKLVGINTAIRSESGGFQGISFAIPSNLVKRVCHDLVRHGRVRRGWIGFLVKEARRGIGNEDSSLSILSVMRNSPAEAAGLMSGDVIKRVDGVKITTLGSLLRSVGNKPVGSTIEIAISRGGRMENYALVLRERTVYKKIRTGMNRLYLLYGIEIGENSRTGDVIISEVSPRSVIYNLKKGDIILSADGIDVTSLESFIRIFNRHESHFEKIMVSRDSRTLEIRLSK